MDCNCNQEAEEKKLLDRKGFLTKITVWAGSFIGLVLTFPLVTAMLDPVTRKKKKVWRKVGNVSEFETENFKLVNFENASPYEWSEKIAKTSAYVRKKENGELVAFSINCAHLGCPVRWEKESKLFMCPCHGGVYYKDGSRAAGPPPRGMYEYPIRVMGQQVEIETEGLPITNITS